MKISIVATLYQSAPHIEEFYRRAGAAARELVKEAYEIILVNDGSTDNSLDLAVCLTEEDSSVVVIDLSRNFGHYKAMMTGLAQARGDQVFLIDSDLEEEPEWLLPFFKRMAQERCDVVYGVQEKRKGGWFERWSGKTFYFLVRRLTGLPLPENIVTARLMTRRYVEALLRHEEREIFIPGLWYLTGFDQRSQTVKKHNTSKSTYTLRQKMSVLMNAITSFSDAPLIGVLIFGVVIFIAAVLYSVYLIINWMYLGPPPGSWSFVMASIWLLGGLIISLIGVIGLYLAKILSETKRRPYTIARQVYGKQDQ
jgi:putative glycosyltransferase